jgi:hypothetical protein
MVRRISSMYPFYSIYLCTYICIYRFDQYTAKSSMYICMYVCMYACMHVHTYVAKQTNTYVLCDTCVLYRCVHTIAFGLPPV